MTPAPDRLAITGIGVVWPTASAASGSGTAFATDTRLRAPIEAFDASSFACRVAAPLPGFRSTTPRRSMAMTPIRCASPPFVPARRCRCRIAPTRATTRAPRSPQVVAAREAWADAGLQLGEPGAGVIVGTGSGGIDIGEEQYGSLRRRLEADHALRHSRVDLRDGVRARCRSPCACTASATCCRAAARVRPMPWVSNADPARRRRRRRAHGRRRPLRHAGDDLRLLAHESRRDPLQQ